MGCLESNVGCRESNKGDLEYKKVNYGLRICCYFLPAEFCFFEVRYFRCDYLLQTHTVLRNWCTLTQAEAKNQEQEPCQTIQTPWQTIPQSFTPLNTQLLKRRSWHWTRPASPYVGTWATASSTLNSGKVFELSCCVASQRPPQRLGPWVRYIRNVQLQTDWKAAWILITGLFIGR